MSFVSSILISSKVDELAQTVQDWFYRRTGKLLTLSELSTGVTYCQLVSELYPAALDCEKIRLAPICRTERAINWRRLQRALQILKVDRKMDIYDLTAPIGNLEFCIWFMNFYKINETRPILVEYQEPIADEEKDPKWVEKYLDDQFITNIGQSVVDNEDSLGWLMVTKEEKELLRIDEFSHLWQVQTAGKEVLGIFGAKHGKEVTEEMIDEWRADQDKKSSGKRAELKEDRLSMWEYSQRLVPMEFVHLEPETFISDPIKSKICFLQIDILAKICEKVVEATLVITRWKETLSIGSIPAAIVEMSEEQIKKMREAQADVARKQAEIDRLKREKAELEEKVRKIEVERGLRAKEPKESASRNLDDVWATINELKKQLDNCQVQTRVTANNLRKTETRIRIIDAANLQAKSMDEDDVRPSTSTAPQILPLKLRASDDTIIACDEDVACKSNYIKMKLERLKKEDPSYGWLDRPIPVRKVDGPTLVKILEWCEKHRHEIYIPKAPHEDPRINLTKADLEYMDMTSEQLLAVCIGANDIGVPGIVDIITQKIADMAKGKSVEEIREIYCLHDDDDDPKNKKKKKKKKAAISIVAAPQPSSNNGK